MAVSLIKYMSGKKKKLKKKFIVDTEIKNLSIFDYKFEFRSLI